MGCKWLYQRIGGLSSDITATSSGGAAVWEGEDMMVHFFLLVRWPLTLPEEPPFIKPLTIKTFRKASDKSGQLQSEVSHMWNFGHAQRSNINFLHWGSSLLLTAGSLALTHWKNWCFLSPPSQSLVLLSPDLVPSIKSAHLQVVRWGFLGGHLNEAYA